MELSTRLVLALSIVAACVVIGGLALLFTGKRRRREKLRRRGIKDYNRKGRTSRD